MHRCCPSVRLSVCLFVCRQNATKRDFLKNYAIQSYGLYCRTQAFQTTHYATPKIQDGGDPPSWMLTPKCKNAINNLEEWCLLTTYKQLCNWVFQKKPLLDPKNPRWLRSAIFKIDMTSLSRVSILTRDIDIAILFVCPSVRDVPVSDENGLT